MKKILYSIYLNLFLLILGLANYNLVYSQTRYFVTLSNLNSRPLALGGAFFSAEDDIASVNYNPSTVSLYSTGRGGKFTFFINPILPLVSIENPEYFGDRKASRATEILNSFKYIIKGIIYSKRSFILGVLFNEESLNSIESSEKFFNPKNFRNNNYNTLLLNIKLAKRLSFGFAGNIFSKITPDGRVIKHKWGASYGLLMESGEDFSVGITYIDLPYNFSEYRKKIERICDETINAGISYKFYKSTTFYLDIRNLNEEEQIPKREMHFGLENDFIRHISLRFGYFQIKQTEHSEKIDVYSLGFGLIDFNEFCKTENRFTHKNYIFNYCAVFERYYNEDVVWHFLSLNLRI